MKYNDLYQLCSDILYEFYDTCSSIIYPGGALSEAVTPIAEFYVDKLVNQMPQNEFSIDLIISCKSDLKNVFFDFFPLSDDEEEDDEEDVFEFEPDDANGIIRRLAEILYNCKKRPSYISFLPDQHRHDEIGVSQNIENRETDQKLQEHLNHQGNRKSLMELDEILKRTKSMIQDYAGDDPDKFFYANRYVFARLQLLERQEKVGIKKQLMATKAVCHGCGKPIESPKGVAVHRLDGEKAYSQENCVLMHQECHEKFHAENPSGKGGRRASSKSIGDSQAMKVLSKVSKRYDGHAFLYWWDIAPNAAESLKQYDLVEFVQKDTHERCSIPTAALSGFLVEDRKTTRGEGNWGIRVLKERPDALAFEPSRNGKNWLFLPVVWENDNEGEPQTSD